MINLDEKYESLLKERPDAVMMRLDMNRIFFNELKRLDELNMPYDELYNAFERLAYRLKNDTGSDDAVLGILSILEYGKETE